MSLPEPRPPIQNTNIKFQVANGNVNKAVSVFHLSLQLWFGNIVISLCLPVFACDFLSPKVNCIFGVDTCRAFKFVHCCDTGTMYSEPYVLLLLNSAITHHLRPILSVRKVLQYN